MSERRGLLHLQEEYFRNPDVDKPLTEIYRDLDAVTYEVFPEDQHLFHELRLVALMPPLVLDGTLVKGILYTQAPDLVKSRFPRLEEYFFLAANSGWCSFPHSEHADIRFTVYNNPHRLKWYLDCHPEKKTASFVPESFWQFLINEQRFSGMGDANRDIDLLLVARPHSFKNPDLVAEAVNICYRRGRKTRFVWVLGERFSDFLPSSIKVMEKVEKALGPARDCMEIHEIVSLDDMPHLYARSKLLVHASLLEGKNRSIIEAVLTDTPVLACEAYNRYARGMVPIFPFGAGRTFEYNAEALADAILEELKEPSISGAREEHKHSRQHFLKSCINSIDYYRYMVPGFSDDIFSCGWAQEASRYCYGAPLHQHLRSIMMTTGINTFPAFFDRIETLIKSKL